MKFGIFGQMAAWGFVMLGILCLFAILGGCMSAGVGRLHGAIYLDPAPSQVLVTVPPPSKPPAEVLVVPADPPVLGS